MAEWIVEHCSLIVIEVSQIIVHEDDNPKPVFDLLDSHPLASEDLAQVALASLKADAAVGGDDPVRLSWKGNDNVPFAVPNALFSLSKFSV